MTQDNREQELLSKVPEDGSAVGNTSLMRDLRWPEAEYWDVRNVLIDRGVLALGRGRGGSVRRVVTPAADFHGTIAAPAEEESGAPAVAPVHEPEREQDLYEPLANVITERWVKDKRFESAITQITALQGRRGTGGTWSRPDITVATLATYPYVPGRHFDVVTFEVKPSWGVDVTAVYEALGHLRCATRSYALLHVPDEESEDARDTLTEICAEAKRHGVGVVTFSTPASYDTWSELVEPVRLDPEPRKLNDFLATQFTHDQLERIVKWFR